MDRKICAALEEAERVFPQREQSTLLVEAVVHHFDLRVGFEVVREQHDRYRHLAQVINLRMINGRHVNERHINRSLFNAKLACLNTE